MSFARQILSAALVFLFAACGRDAVVGVVDDEAPAAAGNNAFGTVPPPSPAGAADESVPPPAIPPQPSGNAGPPYPIVLMHGMAGFNKLQHLPLDISYFAGVQDDLVKGGESVFVTVAPPYDSSEERVKALAPQLDEILKKTGKAKVNLVGHSQGGMDARVLASPNGLGLGDRIASVTTVSTPHRGSGVADFSLGIVDHLPDGPVDAVLGGVLTLLQATVYEAQNDPHIRAQLDELSEKHMNGLFNPKYVDDPRVVYASYAGRTNFSTGLGYCGGARFKDDPSKLDAASPEFVPLAVYLGGWKGVANDGLVTVPSAKWGTFMQCVPADHLKEVGVLSLPGKDPLSGYDHVEFFRTLVKRIRADGL